MTKITVVEDIALPYRVEIGSVDYTEVVENSFGSTDNIVTLISEDVDWTFVRAFKHRSDAVDAAHFLEEKHPRVRVVEVRA